LRFSTRIEPGQWGQCVRQWQKGGPTFANHQDAYTLLWEVALEAIRQAVMPAAPSRLACVFGCCSHTDAVMFRDRFRPGYQVYSVEVATGVPTFIADYDVVTNSVSGPFVDTFVGQAFRYWAVTPVGMREVLIGGPATVCC
jgi:hypothetical protein